MGLMKAPVMFMKNMNNPFSSMLNSSLPVFLDDILVYSLIVKEHIILLKKVLVCLHQYIFYSKLKKCRLLCDSTAFIGFDIKPDNMHTSKPKIWSLIDWLAPTMIKQIQLFLGFF